MESTENQNEPVLNVEETTSGESLTQQAGDSENNNPVDNESVSNKKEESLDEKEYELDSFDPAAFMNRDEDSSSEEEEEGSSDDNNDLAWPELSNDSESSEETEVAENEEVVNNEETSNQEVTSNEVTQDQFKSFTNQLGLEAENIEELKEVLNHIVEENNKLTKQLESPNQPVTNKRLDDLNNFLKLDDVDLVRKSLEAEGLKDDKLQYAVDRLTDTGLIDVEALKVRNGIEKAITSENQKIINEREETVAKQQESHTQAVESFGNYMQGVDSLFSFKLTGNPDNLPEVRRNHTDYVTSGKYLKEITESEKNLAESSWLWRNREVLKNALVNNGRQNGRKEILDKIGVPDKRTPQRFTNPVDTGDFDPRKFVQG
jgi:hypothetical protein